MSGIQGGGKGREMSVGVQGHYLLKSSPFNAVAGKLTTQSLVVDHMNAHYRKLTHAKPAIDTGVPASYVRSQKVRDRQRREALFRGEALPSASPRRSRPGSARSRAESRQSDVALAEISAEGSYIEDGYDHCDEEGLQVGDYTGHQRSLDAYARGLIDSRTDAMGSLANASYRGDTPWVPQSARSAGADSRSGSCTTSKSVSKGQQIALAKDTVLRKGTSADILDKRHHKFTEPAKAFMPRTLKKEVPSALSRYKYYNRPQRSASEPTQTAAASGQQGHTDNNETSRDTAERSICEETLVSRDYERGSSIGHGTVPRLEISLDADHIRWLKEQSAERRATQRPSANDTGSDKRNLVQPAVMPAAPPRPAPRKTADISSTQQQISREEEELKYLSFVTDVTNDILNRGIFSDRVLQQVFEEHISRERSNLAEHRMRALLETLRDDLGISSPSPAVSSSWAGNAEVPPPKRSTAPINGAPAAAASQPGPQASWREPRITGGTSMRLHGKTQEGAGGDTGITEKLRTETLPNIHAMQNHVTAHTHQPGIADDVLSTNSSLVIDEDLVDAPSSVSGEHRSASSHHSGDSDAESSSAQHLHRQSASLDAPVNASEESDTEESDAELRQAHQRSLAVLQRVEDSTKSVDDAGSHHSYSPADDFDAYNSEDDRRSPALS